MIMAVRAGGTASKTSLAYPFKPRPRSWRTCRVSRRRFSLAFRRTIWSTQGGRSASSCSHIDVAEVIAWELDLATVCDILWFFAARPIGLRWRSTQMSQPTIAQSAELVQAAAIIVTHWPDGLYRWLDDNKMAQMGSQGLAAEFGTLSTRIAAGLRGRALELVQDRFAWYLAERWDGLGLRPWSKLYRTPNSLSITKSARAIHVGVARLKSMVQQGQVPGTQLNTGVRTWGRISSADLEALREELSSRHTLASLAEALGISHAIAKSLQRLRLLNGTKPTGKKWTFDRDEPKALIARVAAYASSGPRRGPVVSLAEIGRTRLKLSAVIAAILDGELQVWQRGEPSEGLAALVVRREDVVDLSEKRKAGMVPFTPRKDRLSVRDIAKSLHVGSRVITELVHRGLLVPDCRYRRAGGAFSPRAVEEFCRNFAFTREIAVPGIIGARAKIRFLTERGETPVIAPDRSRLIQAVWTRAVVDRYKESAADSRA